VPNVGAKPDHADAQIGIVPPNPPYEVKTADRLQDTYTISFKPFDGRK
jgi:hypothetical protein